MDLSSTAQFLETFEVQLVTLCLIVFDVTASVVGMLLMCRGAPESAFSRATLHVIEVAARILRPLRL